MQIIHTAVLRAEEGYCWHHPDQEKADVKVMAVNSPPHLIRRVLFHGDVLVDASSTNIVYCVSDKHVTTKPTIVYTVTHAMLTACGTLFQFNYAIQTSPTDCSDDSWRHTFFGKLEHYGALWLWHAAP